YAPQADFELFSENMQANPQMAQVSPLKGLGRLQLYSGEVSLARNVTTLPTPGHASVLVASSGEMAIISGDLAHHPAQVDHPEWSPAWEHDPKMSAASRKRIIERLESERGIAAFCHFPGEGFGRIVRSGNRRVFQAL
ncbi:MAG TPA: hypothetical protein VIP09_10145, partial [Dehalococcoidia bacterium]